MAPEYVSVGQSTLRSRSLEQPSNPKIPQPVGTELVLKALPSIAAPEWDFRTSNSDCKPSSESHEHCRFDFPPQCDRATEGTWVSEGGVEYSDARWDSSVGRSRKLGEAEAVS